MLHFKNTKNIFLLLLILLGSQLSRAQLNPPSLRCASVNGVGDVTLNWIIPPDPSALFSSYQIFSSALQAGPFSTVGIVNTYTQNTFTDLGANGNTASQYYYIKTVSSTSTNTSVPSDTLRSIFLNANNINGKVNLTWNKTRTPLLPSASTTFILSRESPPTVWTTLYNGPLLKYIDTISICKIFYNYNIETSDGMGCTSQSNINGGLYDDQTSPDIPLLDSVSVNANGTVTLGWQPSTAKDATRYVIYKNTGTNTGVDTVNGRLTTSYTYTNSTANTGPETFLIAAMDSCKNITPLGIRQTTIFLSLSYDFCARTAKLSWTNYGNLPQGISSYKVYCSVNGGSPNVLGTTAANAYSHPNLNPGDMYCYFVKVLNTGEGITANSNIKCLIATAPQAPAYVYIRSVSVNAARQVEITYIIDNSKPYKGATIFKSKDGITFNQLSYQASTSTTLQTYVDKDVATTEKNYYYKVQISDSCGNPGSFSNISKTILLHVTNDNSNIFYNTLTWDDYSTWLGGVASYNIYRAVNGVFDATAFTNIPYGTRIFVDNVEEFVSENGKFSYYVEAVEGAGNSYGFKDVAKSNPADAYVEVNVFVPNSFSPKGINKIWLPVAQFVEKTDYKVTVFNRWGTKVFETANDTDGWDGGNATDDVYVYLVDYKNARGEFIQLKGYITLIR